MGEAVGFRAGSPGFRDILPLAERGREWEPASGEPLVQERSWGRGGPGSPWEEPPALPGLHSQHRPPGGEAVQTRPRSPRSQEP